jgi:uncharacterized protein YbbC (DUF1343 family)/CubicO group peptidase (beta-lactamase class C family)
VISVKALQHALDKAVADSSSPGAVAFVGRGNETLFTGASGYRTVQPSRQPAAVDTLYDLASLTKVIATTTSVLLLVERGALDLDQPVSEIVPMPAFKRFTIKHLLTHTAGLPAHKIWYKEISSLDEAVQRIAEVDLGWAPGERRNYSDLGFMLLGKVVELAGRDSLDAFARDQIFKPLGMDRTCFKPPAAWRDQCAATERCPWRGKIMQGEVHDENAYAIGGVSGHAGLFSTAGDLALFCRAMLEGRLLKPDTIARMTEVGVVPTYLWQVLGWKIDPWAASSEGFLPARRAIGHTGWTGTSLWMDLDSGHFAIQLSNTPHPDRTHRDNRTLRETFYSAVAEACFPASTNAHTGLDRVSWDNFQPLKGKRIALLTNQGAVDLAGRHILDVLSLDQDIAVVRIFSPEHGFTGQAEAGEEVKSQRGSVPLVSLYGDQKKPSAAQLKGLDLFVVDLPDIGARYYTYMATMKACMEACAAAKVPVLVLDRPNPLGGVILEGPVAEETGSLVCCAPIPIRHGMTLGELAVFFKEQDRAIGGVSLTINTLDSWPRSMMAPQYGLPWIPPSPNIPSFESALLYIGMCLLEGVNLNEGRGTDTPFQLIGAPWLDAEAVIQEVRPAERLGLTLEPLVYTPRAIPGKASSTMLPRPGHLPWPTRSWRRSTGGTVTAWSGNRSSIPLRVGRRYASRLSRAPRRMRICCRSRNSMRPSSESGPAGIVSGANSGRNPGAIGGLPPFVHPYPSGALALYKTV